MPEGARGEEIEQKSPQPTRQEYPQSLDEQMRLEKQLKADGFKADMGISVAQSSVMDPHERNDMYAGMDKKLAEAEKAGKKTVLVHHPNVTGTSLWIEQ